MRNEGHQKVFELERQSLVEEYILKHFESLNLKRQSESIIHESDKIYFENEGFWHQILREPIQKMNRVKLAGFKLIDWFPRSPGLYHTDGAEWERRIAESFVGKEDGAIFYEPVGKGHMIWGGIGSIRFKPINIEGEECFLSTATSDSFCHSGIPLAIPSALLNKIDFNFDHIFTIMGQLRFLPNFMERFFMHQQGIPQIYVLVDSITRMRPATSSVKITPIVFFISKDEEIQRRPTSYVTYVTCSPNSMEDINRATDWLQTYVSKYNGEIVTNFDQQRPMFENAPFSLQNVMTANIRRTDLDKFEIRNANIICDTINRVQTEVMNMNMSRISVTLGNGVVIHGDFVVAEKIQNSFNRADNAQVSNDLKELLKKFATKVGQMTEKLEKEEAEQTALDLQAFTNEATINSPRKNRLKDYLEAIQQVAARVGEIGGPVLGIVNKLAPLLGLSS